MIYSTYRVLSKFHNDNDELHRLRDEPGPIHKPPSMAVASRPLWALHSVWITDQRPAQNCHGQGVLVAEA